jgi:flagellar protein FliS
LVYSNKAMKAYGKVEVQSKVNSASNVQLIQMLLDGFIETINKAEVQIQKNDIEGKAKSLIKASNIVMGLQTSLDVENGGEIAKNLNELYTYISRRVFEINLQNDVKIIAEVRDLINSIRDAWKQVPELLPSKDANAKFTGASTV